MPLYGPGSPGPPSTLERKLSAPEPILFCWSGGKDSALALHTLLKQNNVHIAALLTTVTEGYDRISMHGVRRELLRRQAESLRVRAPCKGAPLLGVNFEVPPGSYG